MDFVFLAIVGNESKRQFVHRGGDQLKTFMIFGKKRLQPPKVLFEIIQTGHADEKRMNLRLAFSSSTWERVCGNVRTSTLRVYRRKISACEDVGDDDRKIAKAYKFLEWTWNLVSNGQSIEEGVCGGEEKYWLAPGQQEFDRQKKRRRQNSWHREKSRLNGIKREEKRGNSMKTQKISKDTRWMWPDKTEGRHGSRAATTNLPEALERETKKRKQTHRESSIENRQGKEHKKFARRRDDRKMKGVAVVGFGTQKTQSDRQQNKRRLAQSVCVFDGLRCAASASNQTTTNTRAEEEKVVAKQ